MECEPDDDCVFYFRRTPAGAQGSAERRGGSAPPPFFVVCRVDRRPRQVWVARAPSTAGLPGRVKAGGRRAGRVGEPQRRAGVGGGGRSLEAVAPPWSSSPKKGCLRFLEKRDARATIPRVFGPRDARARRIATSAPSLARVSRPLTSAFMMRERHSDDRGAFFFSVGRTGVGVLSSCLRLRGAGSVVCGRF